MKESDISSYTVGEIVALDFKAANVFKEAGIDFCCGGEKNVVTSCLEKGLDPAVMVNKLEQLKEMPVDPQSDFINWSPSHLCDHIVNNHHKYVMNSLPNLVHYTQKIASVHGQRHPELIKVAELFSEINRELLQHLNKEETVLFPAIKEAVNSGSASAKDTVKNEISRLSAEHEFAGGAMDKINSLTDNYAVPVDGCNTYLVTLKLLEEFENDLHIHVHLENNILFPKSLKL